MKARDIMTHSLETIQATESVQHAALRMEQLNIGAIPVYDRQEPVGIITDRDVTVRAIAHGKDPATTTVGEIMTPHVLFCTEDMPLEEVAHIMEYKQIRRLPVKNDEGQFVGVISLGDLAMSANRELAGEVLKEVSGMAYPER
ncbi:MAG: CBS domain-containing protein [Chitinispirillaceae bacterium]